jgi:hypothetical protein
MLAQYSSESLDNTQKQISNEINPNSTHNSFWFLERNFLIKKEWQFVESDTRQEYEWTIARYNLFDDYACKCKTNGGKVVKSEGKTHPARLWLCKRGGCDGSRAQTRTSRKRVTSSPPEQRCHAALLCRTRVSFRHLSFLLLPLSPFPALLL